MKISTVSFPPKIALLLLVTSVLKVNATMRTENPLKAKNSLKMVANNKSESVIGSADNTTANVKFIQQNVVSGRVTANSDSSIMPGVNIIEKGTTNGVVSGGDGRYSLTVHNPNATLVFSFIGYQSIEVPLNGQTVVNVAMSEEVSGINEVVVIGYGVQQKKLVTGSTTQVSNEDLVQNHVTRIESALQGISPGVNITQRSNQPGSDFNITIRGLGTVNNSTPLILIDGVPGSLNNLNPEDVSSVDILKDAAAAAIYGSRAANGVILITTKKGVPGQMTISYDGYYGVSNPYRLVPMLNAQEYGIIMNEANANSGQAAIYTPDQINSLGKGTDWQKAALLHNAPFQNHYLSFSGGNEVSTFSASLSYNGQAGLLDYQGKSFYERYGFRFNSSHKFWKIITFGENLTYTHVNSEGIGVGNIYGNTLRNLIQAPPIMNAYDPTQPDGYGRTPYVNPDQANPLAFMHYNYNGHNKTDNVTGDVYGDVKLIKGLTFRTDFGVNLNMNTLQDFHPIYQNTQSDYNTVAYGDQNMRRDFGINWDNTLTYDLQLNKHGFTVLVGTNAQDNHYFFENARKYGGLFTDYFHSVLSNYTTVNASTDVTGDAGPGDSRFSIFGRLNYNYNQKYLATLSLRRDGSSRFGANNRYGYFPSASIGWVITREDFMTQNNWLDFFKFRASWGQNGQEPRDPYVYLSTLSATDRYYYFGSKTEVQNPGISPDILANPNLKWEASQQANIGFDATIIKVFNVTFDFYNKKSKDWIVQTPVPSTTGLANNFPFINGGNVTNKGVELSLEYTKALGDFSIDVRGNLAYNKNKVTDIPNAEKIIHGTTGVLFNGAPEIYRVQEGYPIGYFWGLKTAGIFQTQQEIDSYTDGNGNKIQPNAVPGDVKFVNLNGDSTINDADKTMLGKPDPDYIYGFNLSASYKGFDISFYFQGQTGNQVVENLRDPARYYNTYSTDVLSRWTGPGTSNSQPRVTRGDEANQNWSRFSDLYVHNAGFLRLKTINIGYDFKRTFLREKMPGIKQLRIYVAATNLFTITPYKGMDPEVGYGQYTDSNGIVQDNYAAGIDLGTYPSPRTYFVGLDVKF